MSEDQLRRNVRGFQTEFQRGWPDGRVVVMPSIKANYGLALRRILTEEGAGCDTFGPGELHAALSTGVGSDTQKPFELVIVGGLFSRLLISVFLMPVLYAIVARPHDKLEV